MCIKYIILFFIMFNFIYSGTVENFIKYVNSKTYYDILYSTIQKYPCKGEKSIVSIGKLEPIYQTTAIAGGAYPDNGIWKQNIITNICSEKKDIVIHFHTYSLNNLAYRIMFEGTTLLNNDEQLKAEKWLKNKLIKQCPNVFVKNTKFIKKDGKYNIEEWSIQCKNTIQNVFIGYTYDDNILNFTNIRGKK